MPEDIDDILFEWDFDPFLLNVRRVSGSDGRDVLQMRIDMGILQMEFTGRPDGTRPGGHETTLDRLIAESEKLKEDFSLTEDFLIEIDREFVQFYHRRICWLQLKEFRFAMRDADHTLALMDFCRDISEDEQWVLTHEQYRPFVLFHRTQAAALATLDEGDEETQAESAVHEINVGLERLKALYVKYEAEEEFENEDLAKRLVEMREELRERFAVGKTLHEKLAHAVENEQYELAADLRDQLAKRNSGAH